MGGIIKKSISFIITITFIVSISFVDNSFYNLEQASAEVSETSEDSVTIQIVSQFDSSEEYTMKSDVINKGESYTLPIEYGYSNQVLIGFVDESGNHKKSGDSINVDDLITKGVKTIKYKPVFVPAVTINIINPVTNDIYAQNIVKGYEINSESKIAGNEDYGSVKDINDRILYSYKKCDFDNLVQLLKDSDSPLIKDKLQLDSTIFTYSYQDNMGEHQNEKKSSINDIIFNTDVTFMYNYYANVTIKDNDGNNAAEQEIYKVNYLDDLTDIKLKPRDGFEFEKWITLSDRLVQVNESSGNTTWTLRGVEQNTDLVVSFSDKLTYSFADQNGLAILTELKGTVGKGGNISLPVADNSAAESITPAGKRLIAWKDQNGKQYTTDIDDVQSNLILTPVFGDEVNLSYQTDENKSIHKVGIGEKVKLVEGPSQNNVSFKCWRGSDGKDYNPGDIITVTSDINFRAIYKVKITYKGEDDNIIDEREFELGEKITYPTAPSAKNISFKFDSWYPELSEAATNNEVKAKYSVIKFTVSYYGMTQEVEYGKDASAPDVVPLKDGYTFKGWASDGKNILKDTIIDPIFEINKYTVSFDGIKQQVEYGKSAIVPNAPHKEGYIFAGWSKDSSKIYGDLDILSEYVPITFLVKIDEVLQYVEYGKDAIMPSVPSKEGYTFKGWSNDGKNIKADASITSNFEINKYKVTIDGVEQIVEYGKDAAMPSVPSKEGYTFTGWSNDGKNIKADTSITSNFKKNAEPSVPGDNNTTRPSSDASNIGLFSLIAALSLYVSLVSYKKYTNVTKKN